jgi:hypothetical protein
LTHQFLQQIIEGDELYTRVKKNRAPEESQGWTIVLMDRATRFRWDMQWGRKDRKLLKNAMRLLCHVIEQTDDLTLLTDGERRYGSLLFELCSEALRTGKRGRPKKTLRQGVKVRLKHKGMQRQKRGPKRPQYGPPGANDRFFTVRRNSGRISPCLPYHTAFKNKRIRETSPERVGIRWDISSPLCPLPPRFSSL